LKEPLQANPWNWRSEMEYQARTGAALTEALTIDKFEDEQTITFEMEVDAWIPIQDNPKQRNTEKRLEKAEHLLVYEPSHRLVTMAELPNGQRYKIGGHTRALSWQRFPDRRPPEGMVIVHCIFVKDLDRVEQLYDHEDSPKTVERAVDRVYGGFRKAGFTPVSPLVASAKIGNAILTAERLRTRTGKQPVENTAKTVVRWINELKLLDSLDLRPSRMSGPLVVAALLSFRKYGKSVLPFWEDHNNNNGRKGQNVCDAVFALETVRNQAREQKLVGAGNELIVTGRAISCLEAWRSGETYRVAKNNPTVKQTNLDKYLANIR
jgi:hypothetical protein